MRHHVLTIIFVLFVTRTSAQTAAPDSVTRNVELHEVTVEAPEVIKRADRDVYIPGISVLNASRTGVQLLSAMQIPSLIVDPTTNTISRIGGGNIEIRINGRPSSAQDVAALRPSDILRVEYMPDPALRYGETVAVIDIYVKRRDHGYSLMLNALQSPNRGWGNYDFTAKAHRGRGETAISYNGNPMWNMDCYRINDERIIPAEGEEIIRHEEGIPTKNDLHRHNGTIQYSYAIDKRLLFSAQCRFKYENNDNIVKGIITDSSMAIPSEELDAAPVRSSQADLDLYFHYMLPRRQAIYFNVVGSMIDAGSSRTFIDKAAGIDIRNNIDSRDYRLIIEGIYEKKYRIGVISAGIRNESLSGKADYHNMETTATSRTRDNRLYAFGEWRHNFEKFSYSIGIGSTLYACREPIASTDLTFNPRATLLYRVNNRLTLKFYADGRTISPTLVQSAPVEQAIDQYQYSTGNPDLKPYLLYTGRVSAETSFNGYNAGITAEYKGAENPIMTAKQYDSNRILVNYYNYGSWQEMTLKATLRAPIIRNMLNLSLEGGWHHIQSHGLNYTHTYHQPFINAQLMFIHRGWWAMAKCNSTVNTLQGEIISATNYNLNIFGFGYNLRNVTLMAGITNPFIKSMKMSSRDLSQIAGNNRIYHTKSSQNLVWIGMTVNLHGGRHYRADKRNIENSTDYETLKTTSK